MIEYKFTLTVKSRHPVNTSPPLFVSTLKDRVVTAGKVLNLVLPRISDPDGNDIRNIIVIGLNKPFISGSFPNYKLKPQAKDVGSLTVFITLTDEHPEDVKTATYNFTITIEPAPVDED